MLRGWQGEQGAVPALPQRAQQSELHLVCQHSYTGMLLPAAAQPGAHGKLLFPGTAVSQSVWGRKR